MRPLFPRWSDSALAAALILGGSAVLGAPIALMILVRTPWVTETREPPGQPVQFDHRHHVLDAGIDCLYCHWMADDGPVAGVPPTELCMGCHGQIWNDSPLLAPVRESFFSGDPIPWQRVHALPDFVYFHHGAHVRRGVGCSSCHGHVERMARVHAVATLQMGWCLDCHRAPEMHLRPPEEVTAIDWTPPPDQAARGAALREALGIDPPTHCSACHR